MNTTGRVGDWIQTFTGKAFWPLDPRAEEIDVRDIAHALSLQCRFGGHCADFYSVAEHCVHAADAAAGEPIEVQLWALLHDAAEAYLVDLPRPIKRSVTGYVEIERAIEIAIAEAFGLPAEMSAIVKRIDGALLSAEAARLMVKPPMDWKFEEPPLAGFVLRMWRPDLAEYAFLTRFHRMMGKR